jgi:hypothetical protein
MIGALQSPISKFVRINLFIPLLFSKYYLDPIHIFPSSRSFPDETTPSF